MNYIEWSEEYQREADKLQVKVKALKEELKEKQTKHEDGIRALSNRIAILYSMYIDCKYTASVLRKRGERANG